MKKITAAILIFDVILGLLLFCTFVNKQSKEMSAEGGCTKEEGEPSRKREMTGGAGEAAWQDGPQEAKKIALTFDDGPHFRYTEEILDGLKERGVHATFFVTGEHAALHPDIVERMKEEGHLIGNHTYSHIQLTKANGELFREELMKTNEVLEEITGEETVYVRPPYGSWDKKFEKDLNMIPVLWTVDPEDWRSTDVEGIIRKVVKKAGENDIILMHDYFKTSVTAALRIVDELQAQGYEFVTVEEILLF